MFQERHAWRVVLNGVYDADGRAPCQIDWGLKWFRHPIGASGLRMIDKAYLQPQHRAGARQLNEPRLAPTHNLRGAPSSNVRSVVVVGLR